MMQTTRNTRQKSLILSCLEANSGVHMTAEEVVERLKILDTPVPKATVYRNLGLLEKGGLVKRYTVSDNAPACYQLVDNTQNCHEHYHFMCQTCRQVFHFEDVGLAEALVSAQISNGFVIDGFKTVFYGTCKGCVVK